MKSAAARTPRILASIGASLLTLQFASAALAAPIAAEQRQAFQQLREDPAPEALVRNSHYWVSNENAHDVWRSRIENIGGALIGVGADQVYVLASWARPEVLIPMDFDGSIRDIHFAYGAAFLEAADIEAFRAFWNDDAQARMRDALTRHFGAAQAEASMAAWDSAHGRIQRRFRKITDYYNRKNVPTFINDANTYRRIRTLWQEGRVFPVRGDATGSVGLRAIARALEAAHIQVGVVYLSNVEQYISYDAQTRRNFISLPWADNGLMLRTRPMASLGLTGEDCEYHYNVQLGTNFRQWLSVNRVPDGTRLLLRNLSRTSTPGLSEIVAEPAQSSPPPEIAAP